VLEVAAQPDALDSLEELLRPHGLKEVARTGRIGLARASASPRTHRRTQPVRT
jgi:acetolactate synthase-1/3 small subunit